MAEQFWFLDPTNLFTKDNAKQFVPMPNMTTAEGLNAVVRFAVYAGVLLYVVTHNTNYILLIPAVMGLSYILYTLFPNGKKLEAFLNGKTEHFTMPTPDNPFMNVLLTDIGDNPDRADAAPVSSKAVRVEIAKAFQHTNDIFMDTSDMFDQAQAMRTFHTIQSAQVPNDQDGFLAWLSKGSDAPDLSSAPLARGGKLGSEGYAAARGSAASSATTRA